MSTAFPKRDQLRVGYLSDLLNEVDEQWHSEFEQFVETGEANDAFLSYLDQNEKAQHAVEVAFERQAAKFEELARELKSRQPKEETASTTPTKVAAVVEDALQATAGERDRVVETSTTALAESTPAEEAIILKQVAESLERKLENVV